MKKFADVYLTITDPTVDPKRNEETRLGVGLGGGVVVVLGPRRDG